MKMKTFTTILYFVVIILFAASGCEQDGEFAKHYTINFVGEEVDIEPQSIAHGKYATVPENPEREGYDFGGWFTDNSTFVNKWNFKTDIVTQNITLYAKWELDSGDIDSTLLIGCGKFNLTETEFVSWCVVPYEVSRNSENKLILENNTERVLRWDASFSMEYFDKNEWSPVQLKNISWVDVAYFLLPGETFELPTLAYDRYGSVNLYSLVKNFNNSQKGKYRIGREYEVYSYQPERPFEFVIKSYAEFVVK